MRKALKIIIPGFFVLFILAGVFSWQAEKNKPENIARSFTNNFYAGKVDTYNQFDPKSPYKPKQEDWSVMLGAAKVSGVKSVTVKSFKPITDEKAGNVTEVTLTVKAEKEKQAVVLVNANKAIVKFNAPLSLPVL